MGPPLGEKENCTGARSVTLSPSGGTAATISLPKEHLSTNPPSEPTKNVSKSHGESARDVTPMVVLPLVFRGEIITILWRYNFYATQIVTPTLLTAPLCGNCCCVSAYPELKISLALAPSTVHNRTLPPDPALSTTYSPLRAPGTQFTYMQTHATRIWIT